MPIIEVKSDLIFSVDDSSQTLKETVCAQRIIPYQAVRYCNEISKEWLQYAEHLNSSLQVVNTLYDVRL